MLNKKSSIYFKLGFLAWVLVIGTSPALAEETRVSHLTYHATEQQESTYLVHIINQLDALQSLILAAEKMQRSNERIQFHYRHYSDAQGHSKNGLLEDVQAIKAGIVQYLDQPTIEPRMMTPLEGDYLNLKPIKQEDSVISRSLPLIEIEKEKNHAE